MGDQNSEGREQSLIDSLYKKRPSGILDRAVPSRGMVNTPW